MDPVRNILFFEFSRKYQLFADIFFHSHVRCEIGVASVRLTFVFLFIPTAREREKILHRHHLPPLIRRPIRQVVNSRHGP
jgi:hypothetical protein